MTDSAQARRVWPIGIGVVLLMQAAIHSHVLAWPGFVQDDFCWLEDARRSLVSPGHVLTLNISGFFRPLIHSSFAANHAVAGMNPHVYYAVNLALEMACTLLVGLLARAVGLGVWPGLTAMLLFSSHATHHEIIGWISGRTTSIWTLAGLATLLCWLRWRRSGGAAWWIAAFIAYGAALASKEEAVSLLPILFAADLLLPRRERRSAVTRGDAPPAIPAAAGMGATAQTGSFSIPKRLVAYAPHAALCLGYLLLQRHFQSRNPLVTQGDYGLDAAGMANWLYRLPSLFLTQRVKTWLVALAYGAAGFGIGFALLHPARRRTARVALFGLALSLGALAPTSFFHADVPGNLAARYSYFATIGAALAGAALLQAALERPRRAATAAILVTGLIVLSVLAQYNKQRSGLHRWENESRRGAAEFASLAVSDALRAVRRDSTHPIVIVDPPMGLAHLRSAIWLACGIEPLRIIDAFSPGFDPRTAPPGATVLRWNKRTMQLEHDRETN